MNKKSILITITTFLITCAGCSFIHAQYPSIKEVHDTVIIHDTVKVVPSFFSENPKKGLKKALTYFNVKCPDIVYAQAVLETGNFTSKGCTKDNNLFGIMTRNGKHAKFNHWVESVKAYKNRVQYKHRENENYYKFLSRIGYAQDKTYNAKLKIILKNQNQSKNHEI